MNPRGKETDAAVTCPEVPQANSYWRRQALMDLLSVMSRVIPAVFFSLACLGFWRNFVQTGKWTSLLWMASEGLVVLLLIFRKDSRRISRNPWDWFVALGGSFSVFLVQPTTEYTMPENIGVAMQVAGTAFEIYAKASLGRSFGIVAADRGIIFDGPYRIVRHPIYLGYLLTHIGFLLTNWSPRNVAVYIVVYFFQTSRILSEERLLSADESYRAYSGRVRYRLIPGVF